MITPGWKRLGTACFYLDKAANFFLRRYPERFRMEGSDKTGRVLVRPKALRIFQGDQNVHFIHYPGRLGHSLWRSQELTLFTRYREFLKRPRVDFGCGDGSFAAALFERVDYGLDSDEVPMRTARGYTIYDHLICCRGEALPLKPASVRSIYSNSVLEHVDNLGTVLESLHHILVPGGVLIFTVPVTAFAQHLTAYFGQRYSDLINRSFYHKNLQPPAWWVDQLRHARFDVVEVRHYQPDWFTFFFIVFSSKVFYLFQRTHVATKQLRQKSMQLVGRSLSHTVEGGNILVIAQRSDGPPAQ